MRFINIKGISFIIFFLWLEIIIFSIGLIVGNILSNFIFYFVKILTGRDLYLSNITIVNSIKLTIIFGLISYIQSFFISFLMKIIKRKINLMIYFFNVCLMLAFIIDKILAKTVLKNYSFLWLGFILSFILGSYELIIANRNFFSFPIKKK